MGSIGSSGATRIGDIVRFADLVTDRTMNMTVDPELGMTCVYKFIKIRGICGTFIMTLNFKTRDTALR
jgi:hypothetical protein